MKTAAVAAVTSWMVDGWSLRPPPDRLAALRRARERLGGSGNRPGLGDVVGVLGRSWGDRGAPCQLALTSDRRRVSRHAGAPCWSLWPCSAPPGACTPPTPPAAHDPPSRHPRPPALPCPPSTAPGSPPASQSRVPATWPWPAGGCGC